MSFSSHPPRPRSLAPSHAQVTEPLRPAGMKLAVLVNGGSASASEIVAGAVQDLDAGIVVGPSRTYGKGAAPIQAPIQAPI